MATHCSMYNSQGTTGIAILQGPGFLKQRFYNQSPSEDLTLAKMLVRPCNQFTDDSIMNDEKLLNGDNYGSVKKVYVIAMDDNSLPEELQRWMIVLSSPDAEVEEIAGAGHFVMCSKPRELCDILVKVANKYDS